MTEDQWLAATDPAPMLEFVRDKASTRKSRLLAVALARPLARYAGADLIDRTALVAELMADGQATPEQVLGARAGFIVEYQQLAADTTSRSAVLELGVLLLDDGEVGGAAQTVGYQVIESAVVAATGRLGDYSAEAGVVRAAERAALCRHVREVLDNPFRAVVLIPSWLTSTVVALARQMYESRDFSLMPILADALQDAGCDRADVLDHCRSPGPHVRGCWVVDLVLGKK
jgi:hypothetical protein